MSQVTQRRIASKLGFSQQAVAFALSDNPTSRKQLHPRTCRRIRETAQKMGYVPHHAARRLARARSDRGTSFDQVGLIYLTPTDLSLDKVCVGMMSAEIGRANV